MDWMVLSATTSDERTPNTATFTYGVAMADSVDGMVLVDVDGDVVSQPSDEEVAVTVLAEEFVGGTAVLDPAPFPGTVSVYEEEELESNLMDSGDYVVDDDRLTILSLANDRPVTLMFDTHVSQMLTNDDFADGDYALAGIPANLTLKEQTAGGEDAEVVWSDVAHTVSGSVLHVEGMESADPAITATYEHTESLACSAGDNELPYVVETVTVTHMEMDEDGNVTVITVDNWALDGTTLTLPSTYEDYTVEYTVEFVEEWGLSDQYVYDENADTTTEESGEFVPTVTTVGHDLYFEPDDGSLEVIVDGSVTSSYTLDVNNIVVNYALPTERDLWLEYDAAVNLHLATSSFRNGTITLPYVPTGAVSAYVGGESVVAVSDDLELTISSLVESVSQYVVTYSAQVPEPYVEMPCTPNVLEGQVVQIASIDGTPTVIGCEGAGDSALSVAVEAADLAGTASDDAEESLERVSTAEMNITNVETSISQLDDRIQAEVYARGQSEGVIRDNINSIVADSESITATLTQLSVDVTNTKSATDTEIGDIKTRLDASDSYVNAVSSYVSVTANEDNHPVLELGSSSWDVYAQLTNSMLRFMQGNTEVAHISDQELNITIASIKDHMTLGDWAWIPRSNGNLSLKWIGRVV